MAKNIIDKKFMRKFSGNLFNGINFAIAENRIIGIINLNPTFSIFVFIGKEEHSMPEEGEKKKH